MVEEDDRDVIYPPATGAAKFIATSETGESQSFLGDGSAGPLHIIEAISSDHTFRLNDSALERLLLDPRIVDKKVAVVSVAGAFRKGKSFLLNFFLRFLRANGDEHAGGDWLAANDTLDGFSWRGGSERETSGILMWSEPYIVKNANGEEVVVLLMDTQGSFDSQSTVKDCATIFALSTMVSSVQIYNLSQNVQEDDLQHLQLFTEYGRLALAEGTEGKPFQSLLFLVRDWSFPYEAEYGFQGGQRILDRRLELSDKQHPELQQLRLHIRSCFSDIRCFLMPHPGLRVSTSPEFRGQLNDIEGEFKQQLRVLVPRMLSGQLLVLKEINAAKVTCRELLEYFKVYITIFQGEELPEPKSMLLATAEANNLAAVASAKALYAREMEEVCGGDAPYMPTQELADHHEHCRIAAVKQFRTTRKMGGVDYSLQFLERLEVEMEEQYEKFVKINNSKNLFKSMRTPAVLVVLMIVDYLIQEILQFVGADRLALSASLFLWVVIFALGLWAYSRYSGQLRDVGTFIDDTATSIWTNVLAPLTQEGVQQAVKIGHRLADPGANVTSSRPAQSRGTASTASTSMRSTASTSSSRSTAGSGSKKRN